MMRRIKGWAILLAGALCVVLGILSISNFAFNWDFIMPPSVMLAAVMMVGGGALFAHGLMEVDTRPRRGVVAQKKDIKATGGRAGTSNHRRPGKTFSG